MRVFTTPNVYSILATKIKVERIFPKMWMKFKCKNIADTSLYTYPSATGGP